MPIRFESFIREGDKNEKNIVSDIVSTCNSWGFASFESKTPKYFMYEYPLIDEYTKKEFGLITNLLKIENSKIIIRDCNLTINAEPKRIHLHKHLKVSDEETHDYYLAKEDSLFPTPSFVIEAVNRHAIWDKKLEGKDFYVGLSAFAYGFAVWDSLEEFNKHYNDTSNHPPKNTITKVGLDSATIINEKDDNPCTLFLGEVLDIQDVKVKLKENEIKFSIITIDCFLGLLKLVAGKDVFYFGGIEKGKILEIIATIKANFGVDPTPEAVVGSQTQVPQDNETYDNAITKLADASFNISSELKNKIKRIIKKPKIK